ncbi:hypothetical protein EJ03DRAFT_100274 [Teratosphaeria nubilosa]|uniref:HSF-type DNA-binding domain-containing protein n=1 Tax=Teratosphaeria nubilosa TaxID=161662 RepID=A0A6G1LLJ4_9PEZI|nr:hypothetical protein EJ03DRAFT_100274 [Teratosphaeria nubilosa]
MQPQAASRKRAAPGGSPVVQQPSQPVQPTYAYQQQFPEGADFTFDFPQSFGGDATFNDPSLSTDPANFASFLQNSTQPPAYNQSLVPSPAPQSTELVRRNRNQQLTAQNGYAMTGQEQWNGGSHGNVNGKANDEEDERELEQKVQIARKEAQTKRKQIPPFVQKLSSFLDSNNTELIQWSDDGRSFIVLDEDEFARTLIPELFKHNNYASFVRQLNMYGFHKTVNITDGSLRQSEKARKGVKPPSMYSHPYFRKNRPDLLWLIQKPVSKTGGKRKRDGVTKEHFDSDEERQFSPGPGAAEVGAPGNTNQDLAQLPRNELAAVRRELNQLQNQQRMISQMITQLKEQNDQFYRQATAFQAMHDRHENSINAILTFLATFYNRSLDGSGAQNLVNMFNSSNQTPQQQDSNRVVEEQQDGVTEGDQQLQRFNRKPQLLLPGPIGDLRQQEHFQTPGSAMTEPNSARNSVSPPGSGAALKRQSSSSVPPGHGTSGQSPIIKNGAPTPNLLDHVPENGQPGMTELIEHINSTNASAPGAPAYDWNAFNNFNNANGGTNTASDMRNVLAAMNRSNGAANQNNALTGPAPAMPNLDQLQQTQKQINNLISLQKQQHDKVTELNRRLVPLSPNGSIAGLSNGGDTPLDMVGTPGDYDPSAFINFDDGAYGAEFGNATIDNSGADFNFDDFGNGAGDGGDVDWNFNNEANEGGRIESVSSETTSPRSTMENGVDDEAVGRQAKRSRKSSS